MPSQSKLASWRGQALLHVSRALDLLKSQSNAKAARIVSENRVLLLLVVLIGAIGARQVGLRPQSRAVEPDGRPWASTRPDGSRELWVPYRGRLRRVVIFPTRQTTFDAHVRLFKPRVKGKTPAKATSQFLSELSAILSIILPRVTTKVTGFLALQMILLSLRTYISLVVARLDGRIIRAMVSASGKEFLKGIMQWLLLAVPASYTNAMVSYLNNKIALEFRTKLVRYIHDLYISPNKEYYKLSNIDGEITGADHYITTDVTRFCNAAASLYSNLGKPAVDILLFSYQLSRNLGTAAFFGININYAITASFLKSVAPPFGKLAAKETHLEGDYRNQHARIITNAEEIAFYDGASIERKALTQSYQKIYDHVTKMLRVRAWYWIVEDMVLKYSWSASGFLFASIPVFLPTWTSGGHEKVSDRSNRERSRMGDFITNKRLMLSLSDAGGRLMYSIKDLAELAGYTQRVYELISTLHRIRLNSYSDDEDTPAPELSMADVRGTVQQNYNGLRFEEAPVIVPGLGYDLSPGEPLLDPITFRIGEGDHLLITGPNGVGKSSIARMAAGLWPVFRGLLSEPEDSKITFLPQRPYFHLGSLRDQVIYPDTHAQMLEKGMSDQDLTEILDRVNLDYIPDREGGWDAIKEWKDVFSGGEKQRMMFARILYSQPRFAVIDEGTAAVSQDMEGLMYEVCKKAGVTLITISHRISLLKYHTCMLQVGLGDDGSKWQFERMDTTEGKSSVQEEISEIKKTIALIPEMQKRRKEITKELGLAESEVGAGGTKKS